MNTFISIISAFKKTILLLCNVGVITLALFSSSALAVPLQQPTLNTDANASIGSTFVQTKTSLSIHSNALLHDVSNGTITNSRMYNLVSNQDNENNQDRQTASLSANNWPITLNTAANSDVIGYIQYDTKRVNYDNVDNFVKDINNASDAEVYFNEDIVLNNSIEIKDNATITIHLCGHVLSGAHISTFWCYKNVQIIQVSKNANLTVIGSENDTQANLVHTLNGFNEEGKIKTYKGICGGVITANQDDDIIGIEISGDNSMVTLNNTTIFGCVDTEDEGAGVCIDGENTQLELYNSRIQHCRADSGGGIYIDGNDSYIALPYSSIEYNYADDHGGGIYCDAKGVTIKNTAYYIDSETNRSSISNNKAENDGGGIYCDDASGIIDGIKHRENDGGGKCSNDAGLEISGLKVCNNKAKNGGGAYINSKDNKFDRCIFTENTATSNGGGACIDDSSNILNECTFTGNKAEIGGAVRINSLDPNNHFTLCSFENNTATSDGGAAYVNSKKNSFYECSFTGNKADDDGGSVYVNAKYNTIEKCTFTENTATENGGGAYVNSEDNTFGECTFISNLAENGAGAYVDLGKNLFDGCFFTENTSDQAGSALYDNQAGSPFYDDNDYNALNNCTITSNTSKAKTGAVYVCNTVDITLKGTMNISDNTGHGVYLASGWIYDAYIKIHTANFNTSSWVGVYVEGDADIKNHISVSGDTNKKDDYRKRFYKE